MKTVIAATIVLLQVGCQRQSDRNQSVAQTRYSLGLWKDYVEDCAKANIDLFESRNASKAVNRLKELKIVNDYEAGLLEHDYWGRPFQWEKRVEGDRRIIRITSFGRNGIDELGKGDDISVEIFIASDNSVSAKFRPPR